MFNILLFFLCVQIKLFHCHCHCHCHCVITLPVNNNTIIIINNNNKVNHTCIIYCNSSLCNLENSFLLD